MVFVRLRKAKPKWQDVRPNDPELREAHKIAVENEPRFSQAVIRLFKQLRESTLLGSLRRNLIDPTKTINDIVNEIPWYNPADPEAPGTKFWMQFNDTLVRAYLKIMNESGNATLRRQKIPMKFQVEKAVVPTPANPFSLEWAKKHAAERLADISTKAQATVRQAVVRGLETGESATIIAEGIEGSVGLTARQEAAAQKLFQKQREAGVPFKQAKANRAAYNKQQIAQRAKTIARTETITAESKGMRDAWQLAKEQGLMPEGTVRLWVALTESETICEQCEDLDGTTAPINGAFPDGTDAPPAHPSCRCTTTLEVP